MILLNSYLETDMDTKDEGRPVTALPLDILTMHEMRTAINIMRQIKESQSGYMLVMPDVRKKGRGLFIAGPLLKPDN